MKSTSDSAAFKFSEVVPGSYEVMATKSNWCWKKGSETITVSDKNVADIVIVQEGYQLKVQSTHHAQLVKYLPNQSIA